MRDQVAVVLKAQVAAVAIGDDRDREQHQPEHEPLRLVARERRVDPVDLDDADAREHGGEREQVGVGVGQRAADHEVPGEAEREEDRAVGQRDAGEAVRGLDEDRREARGHEQRGGNEAEQLTVARAQHGGLRARRRARR